MSRRLVKDLMVSLDEYVVLSEKTTFAQALQAMKKAAENWSNHVHPPRAVLVANEAGHIIGQLGHLELLKALEPRYNLLGDLNLLSRAGVSSELLDAVVDGFWRGDLSEVCRRAADIKILELMRPISESIDENTPLSEAIHKVVMWQTMRVLVTRKGKVVGILRLADLVDEVTACLS